MQISTPADISMGHIATNYPLVATKDLGQSPIEIGEAIAEKLRVDKRFMSVTVAKPGFVNMVFTSGYLGESLSKFDIHELNKFAKAKKILIELGAENIAKPMSVGHLRSNVIGMACVRLWRTLGAEVITVNHIGDWGTQFGKLVSAYQKWGSKAEVEKRGILELVELYQRFSSEAKTKPELNDEAREIFRRLENNDPEIKALWKWFVDISLNDYKSLYQRIGVSHDHYLGESFYEDKMQNVIDEMLLKDIAKENEDGSIGIEFPSADLPSTIIRKSNGSTLYLTRDLATFKYRSETFKVDKSYYFVADQQILHFKQLFKTAEMLGWSYKGEHVSFGMVLGESGKKMSTREGTTVLLEDLFARAEDHAQRVIAERGSEVPTEQHAQLIRNLATAAIIYNDLSQNRSTAVIFDWEKMLSFDGDTAPYLLYSIARVNSLAEKANEANLAVGEIIISEELEIKLARELLIYPEALIGAAEKMKPNLLANQLFKIAQTFNSFYAELQIINAENKIANSRLALAFLTRKILRFGLDILGIPTVERM